jgi:hypothetical protein
LRSPSCSLLAALLPSPKMTTTKCRPAKLRKKTLSTLGCSGYQSLKKEEQGIYEIDDAKCKMGTVDIKLDKDYTVILISRY